MASLSLQGAKVASIEEELQLHALLITFDIKTHTCDLGKFSTAECQSN